MPRRIEREENRVVVGVLALDLYIPGPRSLKEKRYVLRKIIDRVRNQFNVSIAETGFNDLWQRSGLGVTMVANERRVIESILSQVPRLIDSWGEAQVSRQDTEFFYLQ